MFSKIEKGIIFIALSLIILNQVGASMCLIGTIVDILVAAVLITAAYTTK